MADLGFTVNTEELPDAKDFSPVPTGDYTVIITNTKLLPTNKTKEKMTQAGIADFEAYRKADPKTDTMLNLELDIQDAGQYQGRKIFMNLNLINESQAAAEIAAGQLKQILEALKIKAFSGKTEDLHNKRLVARIEVKQGKDYLDKTTGQMKAGKPQNEVKKFMAAGAGTASTASGSGAVATEAVKKTPWQK